MAVQSFLAFEDTKYYKTSRKYVTINWRCEDIVASSIRYRPFLKARGFVHTLGLKSQREWNEYYKSGKKPADIPSNPRSVYQNEFNAMGDWLGTGSVADQYRVYRGFEESKKFVHSLGLKNTGDWENYCKSGKKPKDIPSNAYQTYKNDWKGWGDWLGTGATSTHDRKSRSFRKAKEFACSLGLKNQNEWAIYAKSKKEPSDIPADPRSAYRKDWKGYGDWLGTGTVASFNKIYRSFKNAKELIHSLDLKTQAQWSTYCKSGKKPEDIPSYPQYMYRKEWKGVGNWLGTEAIASYNMKFNPFDDARKLVHELGLKSLEAWKNYCKSGSKPVNIPSNPNKTYAKEWKGWGDWLGTGAIAPQDRQFRSFEKAKEFVKSLGAGSQSEWGKYSKRGRRPMDIPANPSSVYID